MTIKRDFEISETRAEQLIQQALDTWADIEGITVDVDELELTVCTENKVHARAWVAIGEL